MIIRNEISNFIPAMVTEGGNQLYKAITDKQQILWFKTGHKINTHIGDIALDNEQKAYCVVRKIGIPYLPDAESIVADGQRWLVTTQVPGTRLLDIYQNLKPDELDFIIEQVFHFIAMLRCGPAKLFGSLTETGPHFNSERTLMEHMLHMRSGLDDARVKRLFPIIEQLSTQKAFERKPVLVHYDLWPGNIFYDEENQIVTVIDLERCFYTDSCAEGASLLGMMDSELLEQRLCEGCPTRVAKMYVYRVLFLLERLDCCKNNEECQSIRCHLDAAMATLLERISCLEEQQWKK